MTGLIKVSDELSELSKELVETIKIEDKEYNFKKTHSYVERNVPASNFKKNIVGMTSSDMEQIVK